MQRKKERKKEKGRQTQRDIQREGTKHRGKEIERTDRYIKAQNKE